MPLSEASSAIPTLTTPRLTLVPPGVDDLEDAFAMWSEPTTTRHIGGRPSSREECWARILRYIGHWVTLGYGFWTVREKATGRFVGEVGFADFKRAIEPSLDGSPEMGWVLAAGARGRGYATEAVHAALAWHDARSGRARVFCIIDPDNAASMRVAAKSDFREIARTTYKDGPTVVFERPRS